MTTHADSRDAGLAGIAESGVLLLRLDQRIRDEAEAGSVEVTRVNLKRTPQGWLMIVESLINGQKFVQFRDLIDLSDLPKALRAVLDDPRWKPSKP